MLTEKEKALRQPCGNEWPKDSAPIAIFFKVDTLIFPRKVENKAQWDDLAALIYTGGTTGVSKGAMLTHANLFTVVQQFRTWFPDLKDGEESLLGIYPIFHSAGYLVSQHLPIWSAWTCILIPRPEPGVIKDMIVAAGFNIYPKEIDEVLFDHPQITGGLRQGNRSIQIISRSKWR